MKLNLKRPMVFFDLETTGTNIASDRIVEISVVKVMPDGEKIEGDVTSWKDFDSSDMVQVVIDGKTYLTHSSNVILISE